MNLNEEQKAFHHAVFAVVQQVPYGRVTTYGHIAYLIGKPKNSRHVGASLKHSAYIVTKLNEDAAGTKYEIHSLPWWRVISASGKISPRERKDQEFLQADKLRAEGVESSNLKVDLDEYGWFEDDVDF